MDWEESLKESLTEDELKESLTEDELEALERAWKEYRDEERDSTRRLLLYLPMGLLNLTSKSVPYLFRRFQQLPRNERPCHVILTTLNIALEAEEDDYHLVTKSLQNLVCQVCQPDILTLCNFGAPRQQPQHAHRSDDDVVRQVFQPLLRTAIAQLDTFQHLVLKGHLNDQQLNLSKSFASSKHCRISVLEIEFHTTQELPPNYDPLIALLQSYAGLEKLSVSNRGVVSADTPSLKNLFRALETSPSNLSHLLVQSSHLHHHHLPLVSAMLQGQANLDSLDLSDNRLFEDPNADGTHAYCNHHTEAFCNIVAKHSSLRELLLADCPFNSKTMHTLFEALTVETCRLQELTIDADVVLERKATWLPLMARFTSLQSLTGLGKLVAHLYSAAPAGKDKDWWDYFTGHRTKRWLHDALRQNTSLEHVDVDTKDVARILSRNKALHGVQAHCWKPPLPLSLWSRLLERLANHKQMDASTLYFFLQSQVERFPETKARRLEREVQSLRQEATKVKEHLLYLSQCEALSVEELQSALRRLIVEATNSENNNSGAIPVASC